MTMPTEEIRLRWARSVFLRDDVSPTEIDQAAGMAGYAFFEFGIRQHEIGEELRVDLGRSWLGRILLRVMGR